jgi:CRISPR system Cascade subunit CasE
MSDLHLIRLLINSPQLMRFAAAQDLLRHDDEGHGYTLHAWLAAVFGPLAPKPFRWNDTRGEVLGYCRQPASVLAEHAAAFAAPQDWEVLRPDSLASKPMPGTWRAGQRLRVEVLACPVSRHDNGEKDIFLRAIDRLGDAVPARADVYREWLVRQCGTALAFEHLELAGHSRVRLLRRRRSSQGGRTSHVVERPQALFHGLAAVADGDAFGEFLARGVGRHRAFGYGMLLLKPAS